MREVDEKLSGRDALGVGSGENQKTRSRANETKKRRRPVTHSQASTASSVNACVTVSSESFFHRRQASWK